MFGNWLKAFVAKLIFVSKIFENVKRQQNFKSNFESNISCDHSAEHLRLFVEAKEAFRGPKLCLTICSKLGKLQPEPIFADLEKSLPSVLRLASSWCSNKILVDF